MQDKVAIVVTSIFHPNKSLRALADGAGKNKWPFIIVGDVSSPKDFYLEGAEYYDVEAQKQSGLKFASLCPERHYTRKNIGYLIAIKNGCNVIVETDDDNIPTSQFWLPRQSTVPGRTIAELGWINIYSLYTKSYIWPRGFPLEEINSVNTISPVKNGEEIYAPIQQGLANENPDVDAVFRMTRQLPVSFEDNGNYHLEKGAWCPFNSQNTTWYHDAFPLLYLPSFCSFRMTDIWRSFVAQRVIWECGWGVMFHNATVWQERNDHSLIKDFEQEVPGYINNNKIKRLLDNLKLKSGKDEIGNNMLLCYEELIRNNIISDNKEIELLMAWLEDVRLLSKRS